MVSATLLDDPEFLAFLVTARRKTYASDNANYIPLFDGSKRYEFQDENRWPQWLYQNDRCGNELFFGREIFFEYRDQSWVPIAQMAYDGLAEGDDEQVLEIFTFLNQVLQQGNPMHPFRGVDGCRDAKKDLAYHCQWDRFGCRVRGSESINRPIGGPYPYYHGHFQFCALR